MPVMVTALRRPVALPPPPEPAGPEEKQIRDDADRALARGLEACEQKLAAMPVAGDDEATPARATGEALTEWAAA